MKRRRSLVLYSLACTVAVVALTAGKANAAFTANNLIDDGVYDNSTSMSAGQIDSWLNANFSNSCISPNRGFEARLPTGYTPSGGFVFGGFASAGQVIAAAAQVYGINPRALLVTLEKEQSLVSGRNDFNGYCNSGVEHKYAAAMGYGCPDSGGTYSYSGVSLYRRNGVEHTSTGTTCVNSASKAGFSQQVIRGAWLLKFGQQRSRGNTSWNVQRTGYPQSGNVWDNSDDPQTCYGGPMTQGTFKRCSNSTPTFYDGYTTIDSTAVHMDTGGTAALYWYTPHFHGNQNFVSLYESWFGPTKGVDYSWQYAGISFSTGSANVTGNTQVTITVSARNTGNQSWSNTNYPVRLATFQPTNHNSALYHPSWVSPVRLATVNESVVLPNEIGTFTFTINVPNVSGLYVEHFNLAAEGATWFPDPDFTIELNITKSTYKWQMVSQSSTNGFRLRPGQTSQFTLVAKNTGNTTWSNSTNPVRLGTFAPTNRSSAFYDSSWINAVRPAVLQESSVAPGSNGTFVFTVTAPTTPGFYIERFNLVMEGVSWFEDPWMEFDIMVGNFYTWQMISQTSSTGSFALSHGAPADFTLTVRNTGNVTWSNSTNPVRLGTFAPTNRSSAFYDSSWINAVRPAVLQESSVAPGSNGTFVFTVTAPTTPGFYIERFNLVMEGVSWFEDPWMEFDIDIH